MAGLDKTALGVYLNRKATAWYWLFPPIHSQDRAEDPKTPKIAYGDEEGKSPEDKDDVTSAGGCESPEDEAKGGDQE